MGILQVALFGRIRMTHQDWSTEIKITRTIQALLAYLLLHRQRTVPRDVLADLFWGEQSQEKAHASLEYGPVAAADGIGAGGRPARHLLDQQFPR
jgi:DNA-binding SARP family transcriptional activator